MALGNAERMWTLQEYITNYKQLQTENERLKAELKKTEDALVDTTKLFTKTIDKYRNSFGTS